MLQRFAHPRPAVPRAVRWVGLILSGFFVLSTALMLGAYFGFQTAAGGRLLRRIAVGEINKKIVGHFDVKTVEFRGTALTLREVVLADPAGVPVARLERLSVQYSVRGLLSQRIDIDNVDMERPELYIRQDATGNNLTRAIAAREPKTEPKKKEEPKDTSDKGWQVNLVRFGLVGGVVDFVKLAAATSPARNVRLDELGIAAAARVQTGNPTGDGDVHLALGGRVNGSGGMTNLPLTMNVDLAAAAGEPRGTANIGLGNLFGVAAVLRSSRDGELDVHHLRLPPQLAESLVDTWPLRVALALSGVATLKGDVVSGNFTLRGEGASGAVTLRGDGNIATQRSDHGVRMEARGIKLSEFLRAVPDVAPLAMAVDVAPGSLALKQLKATVRLDVPRTVLARNAFGPLHLQVGADAGVLERLDLKFPMPGALLTGEGGQRASKQSTTPTAVTFTFAATRIAALRAAVVALGLAELPRMVGAGSVKVTAEGPRNLFDAAPAPGWTVGVLAGFPRLVVATTRFRGIALEATLPSVSAEAQSLELIASLKAPVRVGVALSAKARETKQAPSFPSRTPGPDGAVRGQRVDVDLLRLAVTYPGTRWTTTTPAHLSIEAPPREIPAGSKAPGDGDDDRTVTQPSVVTLQGFALHSGAQKIAIDARRDARNLSATLQVASLRIQDLPRIEAAGVKLAGLLDVSVRADGSPDHPRVDAKVALRDGRADKYKGLTAEVVAALSEKRTVNGTAHIDAGRLGNLTAKFAGPASSPMLATAPVAVTVDIKGIDVGALPIPASAGVAAAGSMQAHLQVQGTVGDPHISAQIKGQQMKIDRTAPADGGREGTSLVADQATDKANEAEGDKSKAAQSVRFDTITIDANYVSPRAEARVALVDDQRGSLHASASSKIPLAALRTPGGLTIGKRPIVGSLRLKNLDPAAISAFVPALKVVRGQITAAFDVAGTVADPQLGGEMSWRKGEAVVMKEQKNDTKASKEDPGRGAAKDNSASVSAAKPMRQTRVEAP